MCEYHKIFFFVEGGGEVGVTRVHDVAVQNLNPGGMNKETMLRLLSVFIIVLMFTKRYC